jgi:hypothetical protein
MLEPVIRFYGIHSTEFALRRPADRAVNLKPIMELIGMEMLESEQELFRTGGASGSIPWSPLEASTLKRKRGDARPLHRSGDEEESLTERGRQYNIFNATRSFVLIGSRAPGVPYQRTGTRHMESREPIQFRDDQVERWVDQVNDFIFHGTT